ncbi:GNAT family N-acetyltransferase [Bradyrhizobium sp. LHD-71]|uniref:GNAT family N-acetyltransferase n=1 Tax=Bradyrhizobium sp. LHD-71 TaxID=3072141 RepID=UPI00280E7B5A|nr:GNAT family N-acetyltransferase [Bradyrhizobium sp. LHD-71]MDQ8731824.1 GNAT family N-acetyltransferase [Bradyrhizobium sp. LHD-71]
MAEIGNAAHAGGGNREVLRAQHGGAAAALGAYPALRDLPAGDWLALAAHAVEPNGYFLPDWQSAVDVSARGRRHVFALAARNEARDLTALLPVVSAWRAFKIPLPVLVSADPYGDLGTPLLDGRAPLDAARAMIVQARTAGAHAIVLRDVTLQGPAIDAIMAALRETGAVPHVLRAEQRACLDATADGEQLLRDALGSKKLKELRRQHNRLAEHGPVVFTVAKTPEDVARAIEIFLALEASGWKASRGTALVQHQGDAAFIRRATVALAARRQCEVVTLSAGETPIAAGIVLRHLDRAFWFKLGVDERFAKFSPGVQLTLELTRHLCADPEIALADSTAAPGQPMIEPIWRSRLPIGDLVIPLRRYDPVVALTIGALRLRAQIRTRVRQLFRLLHSSLRAKRSNPV